VRLRLTAEAIYFFQNLFSGRSRAARSLFDRDQTSVAQKSRHLFGPSTFSLLTLKGGAAHNSQTFVMMAALGKTRLLAALH
jgi:hypothetical protein